MIEPNSTIKNYSYNMAGSVWEAATDIATLAIIARYLGMHRFGDYAFVMAFVAIFRALCGVSLPVIVTREIAISKEKAPFILSAGIQIQGIMSLLTMSLIAVIINIIHQDRLVIHATYFAALGIIFDFFSFLFIGVARGYERMEYPAYRVMIRQTTFLVLVFLLVQLKDDGFIDIFILFMSTHFLGLIYSAYVVISKFAKPVASFDAKLFKHLFLEAYPVAIRRFIRRVTLRVDTLLLNFLRGNVEVGLFHGAYKILQGLMFIGDSLVLAVFPVLSRYYKNGKDSLDELYDRSVRFLTISGGFLGVILYAFSKELITIILGQEYIEATNVLKVFSFLIILMFSAKLLDRMLIVSKKQLYLTLISAVALSINVIFDLVLIPQMGIIGAALATLLAETILFTLGLYYTYKFVSQRPVYLCIVKTVFILSSACVLITWSGIHFGRFTSFICGSMFYLLGIVLLRITPLPEFNEVKDNVIRVFRKHLQTDRP